MKEEIYQNPYIYIFRGYLLEQCVETWWFSKNFLIFGDFFG
jgi:hypothetical protein